MKGSLPDIIDAGDGARVAAGAETLQRQPGRDGEESPEKRRGEPAYA